MSLAVTRTSLAASSSASAPTRTLGDARQDVAGRDGGERDLVARHAPEPVDDHDLVGRDDRQARQPDQVAGDHDPGAREQRLVAVADVLARRQPLDHLQAQRGDRGDREVRCRGRSRAPAPPGRPEAVGHEVAGEARERVREQVDVDLPGGSGRAGREDGQRAGARGTGDDHAAGERVRDARGEHAGREARGDHSRRPWLEHGQVRRVQRVGHQRRRVRVGRCGVEQVREVAGAVLPVVEERPEQRPKDLALPQREVARAGLVLEPAPVARDLLLRVRRLVDHLGGARIDLAFDAERAAVGAHDPDRARDHVAGRRPVEAEVEPAAAADREQPARRVRVARVVERVESQEVAAQVEVESIDEARREVALVDGEVADPATLRHLGRGVRRGLEEANLTQLSGSAGWDHAWVTFHSHVTWTR